MVYFRRRGILQHLVSVYAAALPTHQITASSYGLLPLDLPAIQSNHIPWVSNTKQSANLPLPTTPYETPTPFFPQPPSPQHTRHPKRTHSIQATTPHLVLRTRASACPWSGGTLALTRAHPASPLNQRYVTGRDRENMPFSCLVQLG